jgi:hypothetical protein
MGDKMRAKANEFIDFWTRISVHSAEQYEVPNGEQGVAELARRCVAMAETVGLSKEELEAEVGDLVTYIDVKLTAANQRAGAVKPLA